MNRFINYDAGECWNKSQPAKPVGICSHCGKKGHEESACWNKNSSSRPAANCSHCGKKGHEESVCWNKSPPTKPLANCSHCGKKGHEESVCYKKNSNGKSNPNLSMSVTDNPKWTQFQGRGVRAMNCKREQDHSAVSFPLQLVGISTKSSQESKPRADAWIEDLDNDAIMCQHDCRESFCFKRFANKCAKQLSQGGIVVSRRDEEAIWETMINYGIPNNGFGQSSAMEIDEVF